MLVSCLRRPGRSLLDLPAGWVEGGQEGTFLVAEGDSLILIGGLARSGNPPCLSPTASPSPIAASPRKSFPAIASSSHRFPWPHRRHPLRRGSPPLVPPRFPIPRPWRRTPSPRYDRSLPCPFATTRRLIRRDVLIVEGVPALLFPSLTAPHPGAHLPRLSRAHAPPTLLREYALRGYTEAECATLFNERRREEHPAVRRHPRQRNLRNANGCAMITAEPRSA